MSSVCFQHEIKTFNYKINNLLKQIKTIYILFNKYVCGPHSHMSSGAGTSHPSGTPEFTPGFSGFRGTRSLVLCVCLIHVGRCLSFCPFSFGHCVVCSSIYGFWLPLWYLKTILTFIDVNSDRQHSMKLDLFFVQQLYLWFTFPHVSVY
jgi:hypothetical protein